MRRLCALFLALSCAVPVLEAQTGHPQVRQGFWISVGFGVGVYELNCDGCSFERAIDKSGNLRMGGSVSQKVLVGGEVMAWSHYADGVDEWGGALTAVMLYYPSSSGGLFLKGGLGVGGYDASGYGWQQTATGLALSGGLGYDLRLATNFSVTPYLNGFYAFQAPLELSGSPTGTDATQELVQIGFAITFH
jgi:hypothetical protein